VEGLRLLPVIKAACLGQMGSLLPLQCRFVGLARALHVLQKWSPCLRRCRWHRMQTPVLKILFSLTPKHIQEGLSPGHLKKAKLMFFFTRYPSSSLLKAYFPDVQVKSHNALQPWSNSSVAVCGAHCEASPRSSRTRYVNDRTDATPSSKTA
jgi:hypothetical protein